ncbi:Ig-like domain repeat protein [Nocardioides sp. 616]|uniref:Ig-like domain repeat protein n=1 Tax=Nocardioides sp. 616 TaxID=2268090 RepID=UPI0013B393ED|nr:Ig-like domain repeat protein [Nocardioides sp. 616]
MSTAQSNSVTTELSWSKIPGATKYAVMVDDDSSFGSPEFSETTTNTNSVPKSVLRAGLNHWRVQAISASNEASGWSTATFENAQVGVPVLRSPADKSTLNQPADPPLLRWSPVDGASKYLIEVANNTAFVGASNYETGTTGLVVPNPLGEGEWFWRVKASRGTGLVSLPSATYMFRIKAIPAPVLTSPADNPDQSVEDVVLDWEPVDGARSYEVQVANNASYTTPVETKTGIMGTRYSPPAGYKNDQYYWRVRAIDLAGTPTPWTESQFNFKREWPDRPWPVHPVQDGLPAESDNLSHNPLDLPLKTITEAAPYLQWTPVQHATYYQLELSGDANFTSVTSCRVAGNTYTPFNGVFRDTSFSRSPDENCSFQEGMLTYWRVRPMDAPHNGEIQGIYSPTQRFIWDPEIYTNLSPRAGETVDIPTLRWTPGVAAEKYEVEILASGSSSPMHKAATAGTSYTPIGTALPTSGNPYRWRIVAVEAGGRRSAFSPYQSFNVSGNVPDTAAPPLAALTGKVTDTPTARAPQLRWEPMPGADHYRVYMGDAGTPFYWNPEADEALVKDLYFPALTETGKRILRPGQYDWSVEAFDADGVLLGRSAENTLRIAGFAEVKNQRIALDGKTLALGGGCRDTLGDNTWCKGMPATPVLEWDAVPDISYYAVYLSEDANFTNLTELSRIPATSNRRYAFTYANLNKALPDNTSGVPYYWHIRPCKAIGVCGPDPVSNATSLAKSAFEKLSPEIVLEQPGPSQKVDTHEVTFDWQDYFETNQSAGVDLDSDGDLDEMSPQAAKQYRIQVDDEATFTAPHIDNVVVDQSTYTAFSKLYPEGPLYWRVTAIDANDNELNWSKVSGLTTSSAPNGAFEKRSRQVLTTSPVDGEVHSGTVPFRWESQPFASSYRLEVYKNADTTYSPANQVFVQPTLRTAAYAWNSILPVSAQAYVWRVRRTDASGNPGPWSQPQTFRVEAGASGLLSPGEGSSLAPDGAVFRWEPVQDAVRYQVDIISNSTGKSVHTAQTVATAYASTQTLTTGGYTWKVTSFDGGGSVLSSGQRTFSVDGDLRALTQPWISTVDGAKVGTELLLNAPSWSQPNVTMSYSWLRNGKGISGATSSSYLVQAADYATEITVQVTGSLPSYASATVTSAPVLAAAGAALVATTPPVVTGARTVGSILTTTTGTWPKGTTHSFQWLRDGATITDATRSTYTLTPADAARPLSVVVTGVLKGNSDGSAVSAPVQVEKMKSTSFAKLSAKKVKRQGRKTAKVTMSITVSVDGIAGPTGTVLVKDRRKKVKKITLKPNQKGTITVRLPLFKKGKHLLTAYYSGTLVIKGSKSRSAKLVVK